LLRGEGLLGDGFVDAEFATLAVAAATVEVLPIGLLDNTLLALEPRRPAFARAACSSRELTWVAILLASLSVRDSCARFEVLVCSMECRAGCASSVCPRPDSIPQARLLSFNNTQ